MVVVCSVHSDRVIPPKSASAEQAPLYPGGIFHVEYIQQYELRTSFSTPSAAWNKIGIENIFTVSLTTYRSRITLNRFTKELSEGDEDAADDQETGGDFVEEFETPVINGDLLQLQEAANSLAKSSQELSHG